MNHWLDIVGVGEDGLSAEATALVANARAVLGPARFRGELKHFVQWRPSLEAMLAQVDKLRGTPTVVLASGNAPDTALERELKGMEVPLVTVGDCTIARSAEEAIYDGVATTRDFLARVATNVASSVKGFR